MAVEAVLLFPVNSQQSARALHEPSFPSSTHSSTKLDQMITSCFVKVQSATFVWLRHRPIGKSVVSCMEDDIESPQAVARSGTRDLLDKPESYWTTIRGNAPVCILS
ncbi:unnamed protein product [Leuciscus chuanchicus]